MYVCMIYIVIKGNRENEWIRTSLHTKSRILHSKKYYFAFSLSFYISSSSLLPSSSLSSSSSLGTFRSEDEEKERKGTLFKCLVVLALER